MKTGERLNQLLAIVVASCAVVSTVVFLRQGRSTPAATAYENHGAVPPRKIDNWDSLISVGHRMGSPDAKLVVLEFSDFECPFCRRFTLGPLEAIRKQYPDDVAVIYRHWPLSYHRFALPAARASECAAASGRFAAMHDALFRLQDSLGLKTFEEIGRSIGIDDPSFRRCLADGAPVPAIEKDLKVAVGLGGTGTPTIVVNGWLHGTPPDSAILDSLVRSVSGLKQDR